MEIPPALLDLLERLPLVLWMTDADCVVRILRGRGIDPDRYVGRTVADVIGCAAPDHPAIAAHRRALAGEYVCEEFRLRRSLRACLGPIRAPDGTVTHVLGLAVDVTDTVIAEEMFALYTRYSPAAAFLRDARGEYRWVNEAYANLYRRTVSDMIGRNTAEFDPPGLAERYAAADAHVLRTGRPLRHTVPFEGPDGTGYALGHRFPVPQPDGGYAVGGVYVDITDLVRAQQKAAEGEERYRALFEGAGIPIATIDLKGYVQDANAEFCHLYGYPTRELRRIRVRELVSREDLDRHLATWLEVAAGRRARHQATVTGITRDGRTFTARLTISLARLPDARPWLAIVTLELLTPPAHRQAELMLTPTEAAVLEALAAGRTNSGIAAELHLSRQAIDYHLANLRRKLAVPSRAALTARAYILGLLDPSRWPPAVPETRIQSGPAGCTP